MNTGLGHLGSFLFSPPFFLPLELAHNFYLVGEGGMKLSPQIYCKDYFLQTLYTPPRLSSRPDQIYVNPLSPLFPTYLHGNAEEIGCKGDILLHLATFFILYISKDTTDSNLRPHLRNRPKSDFSKGTFITLSVSLSFSKRLCGSYYPN